MKHKGSSCVFSFAAGLLIASLLPSDFVVVVGAITLIIICLIFRRRFC